MKSEEIYPIIAREKVIEAVELDVIGFDELFRYLIQAHKAIEIAEKEINTLQQEAKTEKYYDEQKVSERVAENVSFAVSEMEYEKNEQIEKIKTELEDYKGMFESARKLIREQEIEIASLEKLIKYFQGK